MPDRKKGESLNKYIGRCVPIFLKEHPSAKRDQAVAACANMGRSKARKRKKK